MQQSVIQKSNSLNIQITIQCEDVKYLHTVINYTLK